MKSIYLTFAPDAPVPVEQFLRNKKLRKYFNRETAAAVVAIGRLLSIAPINPAATPLYYATGLLEYEDYGLDAIALKSLDTEARFSLQRFVNNGITDISPLNQFKVLLNMPLSFIAIEHGFITDNAAIYASGIGLLYSALYGPDGESLIIGAGKTFADGSVEMGFAVTDKHELGAIDVQDLQQEAYLLLRTWHSEGIG